MSTPAKPSFVTASWIVTGFPVGTGPGDRPQPEIPLGVGHHAMPVVGRHSTPTVLLNPDQRHQGPGDRLARRIDDLSGQVAECLRVRLRQRDLDDKLSAVESGLHSALVRPRDGGCLPVVVAQTILRRRTSQVRHRCDGIGAEARLPLQRHLDRVSRHECFPGAGRDLALLGGEGQADTACVVHDAAEERGHLAHRKP